MISEDAQVLFQRNEVHILFNGMNLIKSIVFHFYVNVVESCSDLFETVSNVFNAVKALHSDSYALLDHRCIINRKIWPHFEEFPGKQDIIMIDCVI